jgi:hypothetical protein
MGCDGAVIGNEKSRQGCRHGKKKSLAAAEAYYGTKRLHRDGHWTVSEKNPLLARYDRTLGLQHHKGECCHSEACFDPVQGWIASK